MFTENKDNTATISVNQTQKPSKERTMATDKVNSLNQVDITQATTLEEQAIILQNNEDYLDSPTTYVDDIANYYPEMYFNNGIEVSNEVCYDIGNAEQDKEFMQEVFNYDVNLTGSVGKDKDNNKEDIKNVASRLNEFGFKDIPQKCIDEGEWDDKLTTAIKEFQTYGKGDAYYARRNYKEKNYSKPNGIVEPDDATFKALFRNTGLPAIFMNRNAVDSKIYVGKTTLDGDVVKGKTNNIEDVKLVAELLVENGIETVPDICLEQGLWHDDLEKSIGEFIPKATWIGKNGNNLKKLTAKRKSQGFLKEMKYDMSTQKHTPGETREEYDNKLGKINEGMGIKEGDDYDIVLRIANKAATDPKYFEELTKDISAKLTNIAANRKDGDVVLSPVLEDRMKRFHKFLVAAGLYEGNMRISDGARSPERAHRWCVEWVIESPEAKSEYKEAVKANLIKMYNDKKFRDGVYVKDIDGNYWAKSEHFYYYNGSDPKYKTKEDYAAALLMEDMGIKKVFEDQEDKHKMKGELKTGIYWDDVVKYVKEYTTYKREEDQSMFRSSSSAAASEGYFDDKRRMPNKSGTSPSITNHKTGEAIDINSKNFILKTEGMIDLLALQFGLIRDGGAGETWHFEMTGVEVTKENEKYLNKE